MIWNLILAHLLGDFLFQVEYILLLKKNIFGIMLHSAICVLVVIFLAPSLLSLPESLILIFTSHTLFDWLKIKIAHYPSLDNIFLFLFDQFLHLIIIFAVSIFWPQEIYSPLYIKYFSFYLIVGPASTILLFYFKKLFYKDRILMAFSKENLYDALERILIFTLVILPPPSYFLIPLVLIGKGYFFEESADAFLNLLASTMIAVFFGIIFKVLWII